MQSIFYWDFLFCFCNCKPCLDNYGTLMLYTKDHTTYLLLILLPVLFHCLYLLLIMVIACTYILLCLLPVLIYYSLWIACTALVWHFNCSLAWILYITSNCMVLDHNVCLAQHRLNLLYFFCLINRIVCLACHKV